MSIWFHVGMTLVFLLLAGFCLVATLAHHEEGESGQVVVSGSYTILMAALAVAALMQVLP